MAGEPQRTVTVVVPSPLRRAELSELFARTCALLGAGAAHRSASAASADPRAGPTRCDLLLCEVAGVAADAVALDALARLALAARRGGCEVRLRGASPELLGLVQLAGLAEVLRAEGEPPAPPARSDALAICGLPFAGGATPRLPPAV